MVHGHRRVKPRQQQACQQRQIPQRPHAGRRDRIDRPVLRRLHQPSDAHRRQKAFRQSVHQQPDLPGKQSLTELVRPLRVLEQRERRCARPAHRLLHRRRREHALQPDRVQPPAHPLDVLLPANAVEIADRHARPAPASQKLLLQPQRRRPQMPPHQARVRAHRLRERILRALDRALRLRRGRPALLARFRLEAERLRLARKQHDAEAVHELLRRRCGVLRPRDRGAPDRAGLRLLQQRLPPVRAEIFAERPEHQLCNVPAGGQPVDKKGRQPFAARLHRMLFKIRRVLKKSPYFLRPHTPHLSHFVTILPPDCKIYSIPFASVHGMCYDKLK